MITYLPIPKERYEQLLLTEDAYLELVQKIRAKKYCEACRECQDKGGNEDE